MSTSSDAEERVVSVDLRSGLLRQILAGAEYSRDALEARLEILLVSQRELVRARQEAVEASDLMHRESASEAQSLATLGREKNQLERKLFALGEELEMTQFWYEQFRVESKTDRRTIANLEWQVQFWQKSFGVLTFFRVVIGLLLLIAAACIGYAIRPYTAAWFSPNVEVETPAPALLNPAVEHRRSAGGEVARGLRYAGGSAPE